MADYTTLADVKTALNATGTADDALIATIITAASRIIDRWCAGSVSEKASNYFALETVTDYDAPALVDSRGALRFWLSKPAIVSVSSLLWRFGDAQTWTTASASEIAALRVSGYVGTLPGVFIRQPVQVSVTFSGGYATIPAEVTDAATRLVMRLYRERRAGLNDLVGNDTTGAATYSSAVTSDIAATLMPYRRMVAI